MTMTKIEERFWKKVDIRELDQCWIWKASTREGYGIFYLNGKTRTAHRVAYFIKNGKIPNGLDILHKCDNPLYCNPNHLYCGTHADNMRDMSIKGRVKPSNRSKLSEKEILAIRSLKGKYKMSQVAVGELFGVDQATIYRIWKADKYRCKEGHILDFVRKLNIGRKK